MRKGHLEAKIIFIYLNTKKGHQVFNYFCFKLYSFNDYVIVYTSNWIKLDEPFFLVVHDRKVCSVHSDAKDITGPAAFAWAEL